VGGTLKNFIRTSQFDILYTFSCNDVNLVDTVKNSIEKFYFFDSARMDILLIV
jgi:hypothetical protein